MKRGRSCVLPKAVRAPVAAARVLALATTLWLTTTTRATARDAHEEAISAGAALAGFTLSTAAMVSIASLPIVRCDQDLACLGTALVSLGGFVLAHPLLSAAAIHGMTTAVDDRQPYWHSLVGQLAGDVLAVSAFATGATLAPERPDGHKSRLTRVLIFSACGLLSAAGPLIARPLLDREKSQARRTTLALTLTF